MHTNFGFGRPNRKSNGQSRERVQLNSTPTLALSFSFSWFSKSFSSWSLSAAKTPDPTNTILYRAPSCFGDLNAAAIAPSTSPLLLASSIWILITPRRRKAVWSSSGRRRSWSLPPCWCYRVLQWNIESGLMISSPNVPKWDCHWKSSSHPGFFDFFWEALTTSGATKPDQQTVCSICCCRREREPERPIWWWMREGWGKAESTYGSINGLLLCSLLLRFEIFTE